MAQRDLVKAIDQAMAALQAARKALLAGEAQNARVKPTRNGKEAVNTPSQAKRVMSEEGRQRIAEAQRKRWAATKRAAKKAARLTGK